MIDRASRAAALRRFFLERQQERQRRYALLDQTTKKFLEAVAAGDLLTVTSLLDAKPSLARDRGASAFLIAVRSRRREIRDLLLARGFEPDLFESLADYSVGFSGLDRVKALVEKDPSNAASLLVEMATFVTDLLNQLYQASQPIEPGRIFGHPYRIQ